MDLTYKILIIGVVYDKDHKFLVATRSKNEKFMPGVYSYHVGDMHFDAKTKYQALENSIHLEVEEEAAIEIENPNYLSSHQYIDGDTKTVAIAFLAKYQSGEPQSKSQEVEALEWMDIDQIRNLDTLPVVHEVYEAAYEHLQEKTRLHHLSVAGLILNSEGKFLLVQDRTSKEDEHLLTFPMGEVVNLPGNAWEMLNQNLKENLSTSYGIEIDDGAIPFTDQSFLGADDTTGLVQFFIGRYSKTSPDAPKVEGIVWKAFEEIDKKDVRPSTYNIFEKANSFINNLAV